jgi:hypothetical protein
MSCGGKSLYWLEIRRETRVGYRGMTNLKMRAGRGLRLRLAAALIPALLLATPMAAQAQAARPQSAAAAPAFYEMRTYYANPGKFENLHARFRDHTLRLFEKAGMTNVAYWTKQDGGDGTLIYVLGYPSKEAREASWASFRANPEWQAAAKASELNGKLVAKVESVFMTMTDYSPHPTTPAGVQLR